jgi:hypothetical protein
MSGVNYGNSSFHKNDLLLVEKYAASLTPVTPTITEAGIAFINSSITQSITTSVQKVLFVGSGSTIWSNLWTVDGVNNRLTYTGTPTKKFLIRCQCFILGTTLPVLTDFALYINGSVSGNTLIRQLIPASSNGNTLNWEWTAQLTSGQYIEIYVIGGNTGASLLVPTQTFGTTVSQPCFQVVIEEVFI